MSWFGLGKKRSQLGNWLDEYGISQEELSKKSGVSNSTISDLCDGNKNVKPYRRTAIKILRVLREYDSEVSAEDFWG